MERLIKNKKLVLLGVLVIFIFGIVSLIVVVNNKKNDGAEEVGVESFLINEVKGDEVGDDVRENEQEKGGNEAANNDSTAVGEIFIHIVGEVNNPGVVKIKQGQRVIDAIEKAGGATDKANLAKINLAFVLSDGQKVIIPSFNDKEMDSYVIDGGGGNGSVVDKSGVLGSGVSMVKQKVNINTATQSELETLNGIGPSIADKIIKYREKNGKFRKVEDLKNVSGIGESKYEGVKDEVCVK